MLNRVDQTVLFLIMFAAFLAALDIGFRIGRRQRKGADESFKKHVGALETSVLGMLALLVGFSFAMSISRFDMRKQLVRDEANAIGTTYLRGRLLPDPPREEVLQLLRDYVDTRLAFFAAGADRDAIDAANVDSARIQQRLWSTAIVLANQDPRSVPTGLFIQSLNDVIDNQEKRLQALENHVPQTVFALVFLVAFLGLGFIGHRCGLDGDRRWKSNALLALMITVALIVVVDLDRPRRGLIRVSQSSILRVREAIQPVRESTTMPSPAQQSPSP